MADSIEFALRVRQARVFHDEHCDLRGVRVVSHLCRAAAARVYELERALAQMLTVEVADAGHIHTRYAKLGALAALGINEDTPIGLYLASHKSALDADTASAPAAEDNA